MLIQSKITGQKYRALRMSHGHFITDKTYYIYYKEALIYYEGIWWDFKQVRIITSGHFRPIGLALPESFQAVDSDIVRVELPRHNRVLANVNCVTPL